MNDFQFLSETHDFLMIRNPIQLHSWVMWVPMLVITLILALVYTQARGRLSPADPFFIRYMVQIIWGLSVCIFFVTGIWSHTFTLSRSGATAQLNDRWAGITYHTRSIPIPELDQAVTESARGGMRIALVIKGGATVYPFGRGYNTEPSMYRAVEDINRFIGGKNPTGDSAADTQERVERKIREAEESTNPQPGVK